MHDHSHAPADGDSDARQRNRRRLTATLVLLLAYMSAEVVGGLLSGSLALLADAGHMLSDAAAAGLSLFALWIATRPATPRRTFGFYRVEILAALVNGAALVAIAILILLEAWKRLHAGEHAVRGELMTAVAAGGLAVNLVVLWILHGGRHDSLNVRGAWLHVLSDTLGSVGAVVSGLLVWQLGWTRADPVVSVFIALLVVHSAYALLREVVEVLMEGTPGHIDLDQVRATLSQAPGVVSVHDLHVWTITTGMEALSGHVVVPRGHPDRPCEELLRELRDALTARFGIHHVTLQIEPEGFDEELVHP